MESMLAERVETISGSMELAPSGEPIHQSRSISFGRFTACPPSRSLTYDGEPVSIGARAYDLLLLLLESSGQLVTKDTIMRYVWPTTTVDDCNVRFQMTSLRRVLRGERDRIKTIPGRGYLFVAEMPKAQATLSSLARVHDEPLKMVSTRRTAIVIIDESPENRESLYRLLRPLAADIISYATIGALSEEMHHSLNWTS